MVINDLCSLKNGISQKIIEEAKKFTVKSFNFNNYFHVLSLDEGKSMQRSMETLIELNNKMQIWRSNYSKEEGEDCEPLSKDEEMKHEDSYNLEALHQSNRHDLEKNKYLDESLVKHVSADFKARNPNNTVMIEK